MREDIDDVIKACTNVVAISSPRAEPLHGFLDVLKEKKRIALFPETDRRSAVEVMYRPEVWTNGHCVQREALVWYFSTKPDGIEYGNLFELEDLDVHYLIVDVMQMIAMVIR